MYTGGTWWANVTHTVTTSDPSESVSSDPRTIEQNRWLTQHQDPNTGIVPGSLGGLAILPDGSAIASAPLVVNGMLGVNKVPYPDRVVLYLNRDGALVSATTTAYGLSTYEIGNAAGVPKELIEQARFSGADNPPTPPPIPSQTRVVPMPDGVAVLRDTMTNAPVPKSQPPLIDLAVIQRVIQGEHAAPYDLPTDLSAIEFTSPASVQPVKLVNRIPASGVAGTPGRAPEERADPATLTPPGAGPVTHAPIPKAAWVVLALAALAALFL